MKKHKRRTVLVTFQIRKDGKRHISGAVQLDHELLRLSGDWWQALGYGIGEQIARMKPRRAEMRENRERLLRNMVDIERQRLGRPLSKREAAAVARRKDVRALLLRGG